MNLALIILNFLFMGSPATGNGPDKVITCHFDQVPFGEFARAIKEKSGVTVYYEASWTDSVRVTLHSDSITVYSAVEKALDGTQLKVSAWHGDLVVMPGENLIEELPSYEPKANLPEILDTVQKVLTASEERYIKGRKADVTETIRIGKKGMPGSTTLAKIRGRITEEETGEPVIGATMYIEETRGGTASDNNGFISMALPPGKYTAIFEFMGLEKKKYLLDILSDGDFSIAMNKTVIQMKEVVVYGDRQMNIRSKDPGLEKISAKAIREIPMLMGEKDILKVSELLPGITSVGEGSAGLNVRGGSADQNAFYINRVPIYNSYHLFGFFPAFNSDIIKDFSIYKGHIPAQYGGRLSSVFNIITRQGNRKKFTLHGGISPVSANLVAEGPFKKDTCSFLVSARTTYSDWILRQIDDPLIRTSSAYFNDFSASVNYDVRKTQVSVFAYLSNDKFKLSDINNYEYSNSGASLNFSHNFSTFLRGEFSLIASKYTFSTQDMQELSSAYQHDYRIDHYEARANFLHSINSKNSLEYGADFTFYGLDRGVVEPYGAQSLRSPVDLGKERGVEGAIYISDSYEVLSWLSTDLGIRFMTFTPLGPETVYTYTPGAPIDTRYIDDTLTYGKAQPIKWYVEPEIRAAVNFKTDPNGAVKVAFNQMHQNLFMLSNTITIAPNTQWKLADYHLLPSRSNQVSLGVFRSLPEGGWEASAEAFYKKTRNQPEFVDGADFLNNPLVETAVLQGDQNAYGIELLLKRMGRRLEGWLAYTYSRSIVKVDGGEPWLRINGGDAFPTNFDIPHVLNSVITYHLSRRITFSTILAYQTGRPVTYPTSVYYVNGVPYIDYSKRNEYRIPDYFRMDLSLTIEGNLRRNKFLHSSVIFNVYNLTGRENPYSVYFKTEGGRIRSYQYSVIAVPVFTVTWLFKLGNYASD